LRDFNFSRSDGPAPHLLHKLLSGLALPK